MMPLSNLLLETDLMRSFAVISEFGSFSAAARRVNRTPSAISMQMKKLEEQLGRQLFVREGRTVRLTADGETLLSYAQDMLRLNEAAVARFHEPAIEGLVRFGAPDDFGTQYVPPILRRFADTHPLVEVEVVLGTSQNLLHRFDEGKLDVTLIASVPGGINDGIGEVVFVEQLVWVGIKGGKSHKLPIVPLALSDAGCCWREAATDGLISAGIDFRIAYTSETVLGQQAALMADLAVAPMPASMVTPQFEVLGSKHRLPALPSYHVCLCQPSGIGAAANAFAHYVRESFKAP
ncbi:MAG: LysR family transcriptional regulator [Rhizobiaceae bacterium]|nr:LysR family transcriptional regulator [Rhizobiaceae bacterium]